MSYLLSGIKIAIATSAETTTSSPLMGFNHLAEDFLLEIVALLKIAIESIALVILALAIIKAVQELIWRNRRMDREEKLAQVRLDLGIALALSLEFLLAADIVATAVAPSWDALGKLATISAIRTFLNFFLEKEVKELAREKLAKFQHRAKQ
ncbi:DUF1622 domain-containing protein [Waterburya agarophytonicola K14]|uniref:DUF1622 domain-containing protein n=1 Tax=Waterburya agarophytonicola KI4 TaxID=2874699 RepID=A0A964FG94_9CYAN|nr:DUF1622 domain-containing protein [Waterburya agarophytonicola]MCC0177957.1 DUF1622 domain-containing protein [Waterburya agarophytonicola KI4]